MTVHRKLYISDYYDGVCAATIKVNFHWSIDHTYRKDYHHEVLQVPNSTALLNSNKFGIL